ncbi:MAG: phosphatase PAP2 family protein [Rhizobiales bacterium]|nr:phosphatase PAP2 family protein [Hyphomicrobiales bacterium]
MAATIRALAGRPAGLALGLLPLYDGRNLWESTLASSDRERFPEIRFEPYPGCPPLLADPIVQCLILLLVTSVFFLLFPGVDLWFSRLFVDPGHGFAVGRIPFFKVVRDIHRSATWIIPVGMLLLLVLKVAMPWRRALVEPRDFWFVLSTLAIASGVVVNLVFKNNWGRPRPFNVDVFGGDLPFVGAWHMSSYCQRNCSFVSGEASSAIWLLTLLVLVPVAWRPTATRIILALVAIFSLNRIAFGGHFLSDVLLSWWMSLAIILALYRFFYINTPAWLDNARLEAQLGRTGIALHRLFRRDKTGGPKAGKAA